MIKESYQEMKFKMSLPDNARIFASYKLAPAGFNRNAMFDIEYQNKIYKPPLTGGVNV
jgi:hypothetical protein